MLILYKMQILDPQLGHTLQIATDGITSQFSSLASVSNGTICKFDFGVGLGVGGG